MIEPSDIKNLLTKLAQDNDDPTCHIGASMLQRGDSVLDVCYHVIRELSGERRRAMKIAADAIKCTALPPIIVEDPSPKAGETR